MGAVRLLIGFGLAALAAELLLHILPVSTGYGLTGVSAAQPILRPIRVQCSSSATPMSPRMRSCLRGT